MSGFAWNVRGLNKKSKHSIIRGWVMDNAFHFGCLLETRVKEAKVSNIFQSTFQDWSLISNYEFNSGGRIWVVWGDNARLTPVFKSSQMITSSILLEGNTDEFFFSFVYASNFQEEKRSFGTRSAIMICR